MGTREAHLIINGAKALIVLVENCLVSLFITALLTVERNSHEKRDFPLLVFISYSLFSIVIQLMCRSCPFA